MYRVAFAALVFGLLVAAPAAASGPELGGRLSAEHMPLVWETDGHWFWVTNTSTIPVRVTLAAGAGWALDASTFDLAVAARRTVNILAAGEQPATIGATLTGIGVTGQEAVGLRFELKVRHASWWERAGSYWPWAVLAALGVILLALRVRRRLA